MSDFNRITLLGTALGAAEIRKTVAGRDMARFSMTTVETWREKATKTKRQKAELHYVVVFNDFLVELAQKQVRRGVRLLLEGKLEARSVVLPSGEEQIYHEVILGVVRSSMTMMSSNAELEALAATSDGLPGLPEAQLPPW